MSAERSEVAHNFAFSGKAKFAFQKSLFQPQRQQFHPRAYGNPNIVPMELGYTSQQSRVPPNTRQNAPVQREQRVCFFCGKTGHTKQNCFQLNRNNQRTQKANNMNQTSYNQQSSEPSSSSYLPPLPPPPPRRFPNSQLQKQKKN